MMYKFGERNVVCHYDLQFETWDCEENTLYFIKSPSELSGRSKSPTLLVKPASPNLAFCGLITISLAIWIENSGKGMDRNSEPRHAN